MGLNRFKFI